MFFIYGVYHNNFIYFFPVQSKALAGAKSFGSFLYSAVNKAGKTVSEASAKIKETVEKNVSNIRNIFSMYLISYWDSMPTLLGNCLN